MESDVGASVIFGLVAGSIPCAAYIAWLDIKDWRRKRNKLQLARGLTRLGWCLSLGAFAFRAVRHYPPIEHGPWFVQVVFSVGVVLSALGFLGVARNYHRERGEADEHD